jgi:transaldolase
MIDIYCDGPTLEELKSLDRNVVRGFTFNPTLFRNLGVTNYLDHCKDVVKYCGSLPISLEVLADNEKEMIRQASILSGLSDSVYVKIPITYTSGKTTLPVISELTQRGIKLNITAVFTKKQVEHILPSLRDTKSIISVFAGRLYDIGIDALHATKTIVKIVHEESDCLVLWASPRMVYDMKSACEAQCDIITMQMSLIKKLSLFSKIPETYSLETVKMFYQDAIASGYSF